MHKLFVEQQEAMLQLPAIVVLISTTTVTGAYAQDVNDTWEQKPTEEKQGGRQREYQTKRPTLHLRHL